MTPEQMKIVADARKVLVKKFRVGQGGYDYPHHHKHGEQWYIPEEWDDDGNYFGPEKPMMPKPVSRDTPDTPETVSEATDTPPKPTSDTPVEVQAEAMLNEGKSIRETAKELGLTPAKVQRLKAKMLLDKAE